MYKNTTRNYSRTPVVKPSNVQLSGDAGWAVSLSASSRLDREAISAQPGLPGDQMYDRRYATAWVAALVSCGAGDDPATLARAQQRATSTGKHTTPGHAPKKE